MSLHPGHLVAVWRRSSAWGDPPRHHTAGTVAAWAGLPLPLYVRLEAGELPEGISRVLVERIAANAPAFRRWLQRAADRHDARRR